MRLYSKLTSGHERVCNLLHLTNQERAAERGLRHNLLLKLHDELEPAFDERPEFPA